MSKARAYTDSDHGYVYFVEAVGAKRIKIGWTLDPKVRLSDLATASPFPLETIKITYGDRAAEMWWHQRFEEFRVHREWFRATPRLRLAIADIPSAPVVDGDGRAAYDHAQECIAGRKR